MNLSDLKPIKKSIIELEPDELNFQLVQLLMNNQETLDNLYENDIQNFNSIKKEITEEFFFKFKGDFTNFRSKGNSSDLAEFLVMVDQGESMKKHLKASTLIIFDETNKKIDDFKNSLKPKKGCYIATMAYGNYNHPQVVELRNFRDNILSKTVFGRIFIKFYYKHSPYLVERLKNKQNVNSIIRKVLDSFIRICLLKK
ncbi:CFI-box-CTERM domain-containing protein [Mariniflexile sp. HNIBRBA6329]|uniref:CFI-box-CTERM domain-containing protein n=1 Tax=Mariniflexile sp. HNIBRBA6329 TaxID=3373088 RepID=UPI0037458090